MVTYFPLSYPILILIDEQEYEVGEVLSFLDLALIAKFLQLSRTLTDDDI